jgi:hypothetical protein
VEITTNRKLFLPLLDFSSDKYYIYATISICFKVKLVMLYIKAFLALFLICPLLSQGLSQEYSHVPFPDSNAIWSEIYYPPAFSNDLPKCQSFALFNEDTLINAQTYHKLFLLKDSVFDRQNAIYMGGKDSCFALELTGF